MNIIKKITIGTLSMMFIGSITIAQSLEDARKAVTAEQYQKAKSLFANLAKNQGTPQNYFYYGDLYLRLNMPDSAKAVFQKGIAADDKGKFTLNYVGLGTVDLFSKNVTAAQANFTKATANMRKKDYLEYVYIGEAYTYEPSRDLTKAFEWFEKAKENGEKDPELHIAMGNAFKANKKNSEAVAEYQRAMSLKDNLLGVEVNIGEIWTQAFNFELSESTLKAVISKDANFGPAYRALAENYYRWASAFPNLKFKTNGGEVANKSTIEQNGNTTTINSTTTIAGDKPGEGGLLAKAKNAYSKYLDLTDRSTDSQYRYLIFLFNAGDYTGLEKSANDFVNSSSYNKNYILAKRFKGYAAVENNNSQAGLDALNAFIKEIEPSRVIADDYLKIGKAYGTLKQDSLAILNYIQASKLDTANTEVLGTIAATYFSSKKYDKSAAYYNRLTKLPKATLKDWFYLGYSNYFSYAAMVRANSKDEVAMKKTLLDADSAFNYVAVTANNIDAYLYLARVEYYLNPVNENNKVKAAYDKLVELTLAKTEQTAADKKNLVESYSSIGAYYIKSDKQKSMESFNKALALDPNNQQVKDAIAALKAG